MHSNICKITLNGKLIIIVLFPSCVTVIIRAPLVRLVTSIRAIAYVARDILVDDATFVRPATMVIRLVNDVTVIMPVRLSTTMALCCAMILVSVLVSHWLPDLSAISVDSQHLEWHHTIRPGVHDVFVLVVRKNVCKAI